MIEPRIQKKLSIQKIQSI